MTIIQPISTPGCGCDAPEQVKPLVSLDAALAVVNSWVPRLQSDETLPLHRAAGRVLAEPVRAQGMAPAFDNAAMDGYAINCADLPGRGPWTLPVTGRVPAGAPIQRPLAARQAIRIFTGAPVPHGADAVIAQEDLLCETDKITIHSRPGTGLNIRRAGADMRQGQGILHAGAVLGPREIAACAAAGAAHVRVKRPLRVSLLVTGNEVRQAGSDRGEAQIWDINTPMITAALLGPQVDLVQVAEGGDDRDALQHAIAQMSGESDLVITTGGISVGEEDHVKPALQALGAEIGFSGVAMKPGKPVSFGRIGAAVWLGLPGNPLSAFVTWQVFGTAIIGAFLGMKSPGPARRHVILGKPLCRKPGRCELRPAQIVGFDEKGREVVDFADRVSSGHVAGLPGSDGLILLPTEAERLPEGALVEFQPFGR